MLTIAPIPTPPRNLDLFVDEMATGLGRLYGGLAEGAYRKVAPMQLAATVRHPSTVAVSAMDGENAAALLLAHIDDDGLAQIVLLHVLAEYRGQGIEAQLLSEAISKLRQSGACRVLTEFLPLCPLNTHETFTDLGFEHIARTIMGAPTDLPSLRGDDPPNSQPLAPEDFGQAAHLIRAAYQNHPDLEIHPDLQSYEGALQYVRDISDGKHGAVKPGYLRAAYAGGKPVALILAYRVAQDVGLAAHLVVDPAHRQRGLGGRLVRDLASAFSSDSVERMTFAVSDRNPAIRLYESLGFKSWQGFDVYSWRKDG